jgi:uncharacterized protein (DUF697 family)
LAVQKFLHKKQDFHSEGSKHSTNWLCYNQAAMRSNIKLVLIYTLLAGLLAALTSPIPGTSLLLTGLEIFMIVHLAKVNRFELNVRTLGFSATAIWGLSTILKDAGLELLRFAPILGWAAATLVAMLFVFFLGTLANLYFSK